MSNSASFHWTRSCYWLLMILASVDALAGPCFVGFDLGTSGARISIIEKQQDDTATATATSIELFSDSIPWTAYDDANAWESVVYSLLESAKTAMAATTTMQRVQSICVSGTSASCLLVDQRGLPTRAKPRMYDYDVSNNDFGTQALALLDKHAPLQHTARAKTSSLAKLVTWILEQPPPLMQEEQQQNDDGGEFLCHQADYIAMKLGSSSSNSNSSSSSSKDGPSVSICSDHHNVLKCGYDVRKLEWPAWVKACLEEAAGADVVPNILPSHVVSPGQPFGTISADIASRFGLNDNVALVGGTTDSNAAFFAATASTGGLSLGTAVTSLGSTLAIKQLSSTYVEDASRGVYSHRFPNHFSSKSETAEEMWLVGGASNVGCAILRQEGFSDDELVTLSNEIDPMIDIPNLSYYPLTKKGERFPVADSDKEPVLTPVPESRRDYLHGILQAMCEVERDGFVVMGELGATPPFPTARVLTCGGGSRNDMWIQMRQRKLNDEFCSDDGGEGIIVERAENTEASYGAAILAAATYV